MDTHASEGAAAENPAVCAWELLSIEVGAAAVEALSACFEQCGACAITLRGGDPGEHLITGTRADGVWSSTVVTGMFPDGAALTPILRAAQRALGLSEPPRYTLERVAARNWQDQLRANFPAMCFAGRLWVRPSWAPRPRDACAEIVLDPGLAFGTGAHASTALCLDWLCGELDLSGARVVDYGCGSGILAIAAARLGAAKAWAIDNDPAACAVAARNACDNGLAGRIEISGLDRLPHACADVLIANMFLDMLVALAPRFAVLLRPGGKMFLSGLLDTQIQTCRDAFAGAFEFACVRRRGEWIGLYARRRPRSAPPR